MSLVLANIDIYFDKCQHAMLQLLNTKLDSYRGGPSFFKSASSIPTRNTSTGQCKACPLWEKTFILQICQIKFQRAMLQLLNASDKHCVEQCPQASKEYMNCSRNHSKNTHMPKRVKPTPARSVTTPHWRSACTPHPSIRTPVALIDSPSLIPRAVQGKWKNDDELRKWCRKPEQQLTNGPRQLNDIPREIIPPKYPKIEKDVVPLSKTTIFQKNPSVYPKISSHRASASYPFTCQHTSPEPALPCRPSDELQVKRSHPRAKLLATTLHLTTPNISSKFTYCSLLLSFLV